MTRINGQKILSHKSYTVKEVAKELNVSEKTVPRWIEIGLEIVPDGKKLILIMGYSIKEFLRKKDAKKKVKLKRSEFYCLTCKCPRTAKHGSITRLKNRKTGICRVCGGKMSRTI